jgi:serine O-acetyltransferase
MRLSLESKQLTAYVARQLESGFPDGEVKTEALERYVSRALERTEHCFARVNNKYFFDGKQTVFNHLHSDQYAMFLYYLSNTIWRLNGDVALASKVYCLNKSLHALDAFYEVGLPDVFSLVHPVGTVLGRGRYADYFVAYQRCTVGSNLAGEYPVMEKGVILFGGSMVIGQCHLGQDCKVAAGSLLMDVDVRAGHVAFGRHPEVCFKPSRRNLRELWFRAPD